MKNLLMVALGGGLGLALTFAGLKLAGIAAPGA